MSVLNVTVNTQRLGELERQALELGQSVPAQLVAGRAAANYVRDYLFDLDAERANRMGGERTHFYSRAAKSLTEPKPDDVGVSFLITQTGFAQRLYGGVITAGKGVSSRTGELTKYLALAATSEAYGKTPGEFDDLEFRPTRNGGMLVQALQTQIVRGKKQKDGSRDFSTIAAGGLVMFWLVPEVTQEADPTVLPSNETIATAAADAEAGFLARHFGSN